MYDYFFTLIFERNMYVFEHAALISQPSAETTETNGFDTFYTQVDAELQTSASRRVNKITHRLTHLSSEDLRDNARKQQQWELGIVRPLTRGQKHNCSLGIYF